MQVDILQGDALELLRQQPDGRFDLCLTSPPYYNLRSYLPAESPLKAMEVGLEETPGQYVAHLVEVFREVRRVLKPTGNLFLNIGDTYGRGDRGKWDGDNQRGQNKRKAWSAGTYPRSTHQLEKCLLGIPWRVALALIDDGWILRNDILWVKSNGLPESVRDRFSRRHEYIFHFVKRPRYYFDLDAVREPHSLATVRRIKQSTIARQTGGFKSNDPEGPYQGGGNSNNRARMAMGLAQKLAENGKWATQGTGQSRTTAGLHEGRWDEYAHPLGKNPGNVWEIATQGLPDAHFAVFPENLCIKPILAGTSPMTCPICGAPWIRVTEQTGHRNRREPAHVPGNTGTKTDSTGWAPTTRATGTFQPSCRCMDNDGSGRSWIIDPFGGSGTTGVVAERLGRNAVLIELNPAYVAIARRRVAREQAQLRLTLEV